MTDWNAEYYRDPSFAAEIARAILYGPSSTYSADEVLIENVAIIIKQRLREELEPIVEQIQDYPISDDEIKRMSAEIRSLYQ